jgi:VWFA-related protein
MGADPFANQFGSMDFAQMALEKQSRVDAKERQRQQKLVDSGTVSALDLAAPAKAVDEFNRATAIMRGQQGQEAIAHLEKAVAEYPKFVSAHNYLGLAYLDYDDPARARNEFETAVSLDPKFAGSFVNLGRMALSQNDYIAAEGFLAQAIALRPTDPNILTVLAYAQHGNREYREAIQTVSRVHAVAHPGSGNAHYVAAVAAVALNDFTLAQSELSLFLAEDPANSLAPTARQNLDILLKHQAAVATRNNQTAEVATRVEPHEDLANSAQLKAQIATVGNETADDRCPECARETMMAEANTAADIPGVDRGAGLPNQYTIRKVVDEVAVFFGVSGGGHSVTDLVLGDITVRDDNKPPSRVLQFSPQSKLPLRIGLLIDTSGSVNPRFSFEKHAASKFLEQMLSNPSDLGFVAGFSDELKIAQDFTSDHAQLQNGVEELTNGGGTALFEAISRSCWKLAAYPEHERVAKVLVVVSDGQENSSRITLRQTVRDMEATGVTVYTISTKEAGKDKTEADKVLAILAERSGGEALFPGDLQTMSGSFNKLRDEIRSRYLIAYKPSDFEANGKYRTISITAEKNGKRYQVHARRGYHAKAEVAAQ